MTGKSFAEHWNGPAFTKMRDEMREVLLMKQKVPYSRSRFEIIKEPCVTAGRCWLKEHVFPRRRRILRRARSEASGNAEEEIRLITGTKKQRKRARISSSKSNPVCEERVGLVPRALSTPPEAPQSAVRLGSDGRGVRLAPQRPRNPQALLTVRAVSPFLPSPRPRSWSRRRGARCPSGRRRRCTGCAARRGSGRRRRRGPRWGG